MKDLAGKVAVVTGAASGIGRATATLLGRAGMRVALADVDADGLLRVKNEIEAEGATAIAVTTDVSSASAIEALRDATLDAFGAVHVVHNNAGVLASGSVDEISLDLWKWVLDVDLWSVIHGIRAFVPLMRAQGEGHVVNTASTAGLRANAGIAPYNVAKFGVVAISETLSLELAGTGIGVSVLCPGPVDTQIVHAERNLPDGVAASTGPVADRFRAGAGTSLSTTGIDPMAVAGMVLEGILHDRFWILTHPEWYDLMDERAQQMRSGGVQHGSNA